MACFKLFDEATHMAWRSWVCPRSIYKSPYRGSARV